MKNTYIGAFLNNSYCFSYSIALLSLKSKPYDLIDVVNGFFYSNNIKVKP